ncbi:hypothetical protein [Candidatus Solirubrobacter pratensis]|uniref:hypothetical protein n=1 Tax=Candidatus Solirubrobacter pratensis TaxID=1298857 RepID=UPI0012DF972C|nr:hypothetical protein [Candidatus Solirubrobacter pratensis]
MNHIVVGVSPAGGKAEETLGEVNEQWSVEEIDADTPARPHDTVILAVPEGLGREIGEQVCNALRGEASAGEREGRR